MQPFMHPLSKFQKYNTRHTN